MAAVTVAAVVLVAIVALLRWSWRHARIEASERALREDFDERLRRAEAGR